MSMESLYRERVRHVRAAERQSKHGFKEGGYVHETAEGKLVPAEVSVSFYGGTKWWIAIEGGKRIELTPVLWARTKGLTI